MCIYREFCALPIFAVDLAGIVLFILDRIHPSAIAAKDRRSVCGGGVLLNAILHQDGGY